MEETTRYLVLHFHTNDKDSRVPGQETILFEVNLMILDNIQIGNIALATLLVIDVVLTGQTGNNWRPGFESQWGSVF